MPNLSTPAKVIERGKSLKSNWSRRTTQQKKWYEMISLKDELAQEGMESVTSNDPRTGYNLSRHLLGSSVIAHKISDTDIIPEEIPGVSYIEGYMEKRWAEEERRYRMMGRRGWLDEVNSFMLSLGWIAVFAMVTKDKIWSEVWHPAEFFQDFSADGLSEGVHIYRLPAAACNRRIKVMKYPIKVVHGPVDVYDYWGFDDAGQVVNAVVINNEFAKKPQVDPYLTKVGRLPIFTSPVGGLPDRGVLTGGMEYQDHYGEAVIATNMDLAKNYNRMLTFLQQLMRDTANPRWFETSQGESAILREEDLFKRGAIFRGAPGESIDALAVPPIPVEVSASLFNYQNQLQRGLYPYPVFGNIQQQISYLAMANIASASLQTLAPYTEGLRGLLTDIDTFYLNMMKENGFRPYGFEMPEKLPKELNFDVRADIEIPGYLVQRATVARMLDPTFKLSTDTVMSRLFPEIRDTNKEQAKSRKDAAMNHPKAIMADQVLAYREQAKVMREAQDSEGAKLYETLATSIETELTQASQPQQESQVSGVEQALRQEALPRESRETPPGFGGV